jgi:phage baseplate assembly protein W
MATVTTNTTREWRDLDLNFKIHPIRKDINKNRAEMAVINSIKNLISTRHYEVPFQPEIGCNVQKLLFEPLDSVTATLIEREIAETINNFEPRAEILKVSVSADTDNNGFKVDMLFKIINRTDPVAIKFFLERVR